MVGFGFLITGLALLLVVNANGKKEDKDITIKDSIIIGLFQAVSLVPGISRSGLTLVGSLLRGLDRKTALKYTFMLYFPVSIASMLVGVKDFSSNNWLTRIVEKGKLWKFTVYLFVIALFTIMFFI